MGRHVHGLHYSLPPRKCPADPGRLGEYLTSCPAAEKAKHPSGLDAIIREIATKGRESRFRKVERGRFELAK